MKKLKQRVTFKKRRRNKMRHSHKMQQQRGGAGFLIWETSTKEMLQKLDTADINQLIKYINTTHKKIENTENGWKTEGWTQADLKKYDDALNKLISKLTEKYLAILNSTFSIEPSIILELNTNMETIYKNYKASLLKQDIKLATQKTENLKKELETIKQSINRIYNRLDEIDGRIKRIDLLIPIYQQKALGLNIISSTTDQTIINEVNKITDINAKIQQLKEEKTKLKEEKTKLETEKTKLETEKTQLEERQKIIKTTKLGGAGNQDTIEFIDSIITEINNFRSDLTNKQSLANAVEDLNNELKSIEKQKQPQQPQQPPQQQQELQEQQQQKQKQEQEEEKQKQEKQKQQEQITVTGNSATGNSSNVLQPQQPPTTDVQMTIDKTRLKELVNKSYVQTMLYLKLAKDIIGANLKETSDDQNLINLQTKINNAIIELTVSEDVAKSLNIDTSVNDDKVSGIMEILLSLVGMGFISATALGGKRKRKRSTRKRMKKYKKGRNTKKRYRKKYRS